MSRLFVHRDNFLKIFQQITLSSNGDDNNKLRILSLLYFFFEIETRGQNERCLSVNIHSTWSGQ